jgi:uncharacterized protein (DUF697 family)
LDILSLFGFVVVTAAAVFYALESSSNWFILAFAVANALACIYAFLQGAWPYGVIEIVWTVVALQRWWLKETNQFVEPGKSHSLLKRGTTLYDAVDMSPETRRIHAVKLVKRFSLWSGVAGLFPLPIVDLAAVGGVQILMLRGISRIYCIPFSENQGKALLASLAGSMIPASSGMGAASMIKSVPVVGTIISAVVMPALSTGATYAIGMAFIQHFATGGTLLDFNPRNHRDSNETPNAV